ncbi:hypothetical protein K450DRAFT_224472 [Umbelopsis ramanniana AG]|uniref:Tyrosine specific protein phosphatases domain-containing protein n=1 Tax=Umbelopsis ramanniana AG TaxID=1314678 RepID=A0AAD5HG63_UMBRA|nr:uncharacterized protein K450DRAFT_224472 [Umbelopsis ramanniana AG]KAI8583155.1 hypothetical protein K450DRAFT_224472 [Umbelopsis ramanniana AG]
MSMMDSIIHYSSQSSVDPSIGLPFVPKNSISHPINISWIIPIEYMAFLSSSGLPDRIDLYDLTISQPSLHLLELQQIRQPIGAPKAFGNLALSSCPGKKVRLNGPVRGRAAINRDLDLDFARLNRQFGITTIVCCLNDAELSFLGAPWPRYYEMATKNNIEILRLPMMEGSCPHTIEEIDIVIDLVSEKMSRGENVLTHCRGGVGRAGLFACCWLLKSRFCHTSERAIRYVRMRRSPKSIETMRQAEFIIHYARYINKLIEHPCIRVMNHHSCTGLILLPLY